jgi:hypothetical protein
MADMNSGGISEAVSLESDIFVIGSRGGIEFIKSASENPILWTGMKDASAEGRKKHSRC